MTHIDLPYLSKIYSKNNNSKLIVIRNNGNYAMPYKQYRKLVKIFGERRLDIDHEEKQPQHGGFWIGIALSVAIGLVVVAAVLTVTLPLNSN